MWAMFAAEYDFKMIEHQLEQTKGWINETDYRKRTALHLAVECGHLEVVNLLIGRIDLAAKDCAGFNALHLAVEMGHETIVARFLDTAPTLGEQTAFNGLTCLHLAAIKGHVTIAKQLLAKKFELIMAQDEFARSPLYFAATYGHKEMVALLVESVQSATDDSYVKPMFFCAAMNGYDQVVSQLLARRPQLIDAVNSKGFSALQLAAKYGRHTIVHQLLAVNPDSTDVVGSTSLLHFAARFGYDTVVARLIVEKPHLMDVAGHGGLTVLHIAADNGHEKVVAQLLAAKPTLATQRDFHGRTALHCAAERGHEKVVAQLLAHIPELINVEDIFERTALFMAVDSNFHAAAACLLAHGATHQADEDALWNVLEGSKRALDAVTNEVVKLMLDLHPELIETVAHGRLDTVLHCVFGFRTRSQLYGEELMLKCWQMYPEALRKVNREHDTPFHVALRSDNKFAVELVQWKLPLDEIVSAYAKCEQECPCLILDHLGECLSQVLNKDVARVVYDYSLDAIVDDTSHDDEEEG